MDAYKLKKLEQLIRKNDYRMDIRCTVTGKIIVDLYKDDYDKEVEKEIVYLICDSLEQALDETYKKFVD